MYLTGGQPHKIVGTTNFATMCGLQFLILEECDVEGDFFAWPKCLRWLQWSKSSKLLELPSTMHLSNLAVLNLNSHHNMTRLWPTELGKPVLQHFEPLSSWVMIYNKSIIYAFDFGILFKFGYATCLSSTTLSIVLHCKS